MCLAVPARITGLLDAGMAKAEIGGIVKEISLALVDDVAVGDYVIVHVGFALSRLDPAEAEATLRLFAEAGMLPGGAAPSGLPQ
jgi:hydrogenase expression/formation protein HypC